MAAAGSVLSYYGDTASFQEPYLQSTTASTSPLVPGFLGVSIGGHAYLAETGFTPFKQDAYRSDSIAPIADKTDISNIPGYGSVNTEGLWRRIMFDFGEGAGQEYFDRDPKVEQSNRFYTSKGIYPWQPNRASLLNDVTAVHSSGNELQVLCVGAYVYINDNGTIRYSTGSLATWTAVTGFTASTTNNAMATDGNNLYVAAGTNGIYLLTISASPATNAQWITGTVSSIWYAGGQLLCASKNLLYNIVVGTGTAGPTALTAAGPSGATSLIYTVPNATFVWSTCAAGNSWVYLGGYTSNASANSGFVYKTQMNSTGTALIVPIVAASLPGGEIPYSLFAYANYILLGTNLGARFCETLGTYDPGGNAGDLKLGPIVPDQIQQVSKPVRAFTGQFRFVWFGWSNYDAVSTGLGRMDLSTFIDQQAPAYTSDLMVTGSGEIWSMDWYNGLNTVSGVNAGSPIFVVNGTGVYTAASTLVAEGTIDAGIMTGGLPDKKIALFADFKVSGVGAIGGLITIDGATLVPVPIQNLSNQLVEQSLPTSSKGEEFDFQVNLYASPSPFLYDLTRGYDSSQEYDTGQVAGQGPVLRRLMVKFLPAVVSGTMHKVIINLFRTAETLGVDQAFFPYQEFFYLDALRQSATVVQFQEGTQLNVPVVIKSITRLPYESYGGPEGGFNQRLEIEMSTLEN